jgi:rhodanese-related sulfurtransferase
MDFEISLGQVKALQQRGETFTLLDVREDWEYEKPHLEGARQQIPSKTAAAIRPE